MARHSRAWWREMIRLWQLGWGLFFAGTGTYVFHRALLQEGWLFALGIEVAAAIFVLGFVLVATALDREREFGRKDDL